MKKKEILLTVVILLTAAGFAQALEGELQGSIDLTYQSKYIWRGFDVYGDKSAIQPAIDLDLYGTGFGINIMAHRANSSVYENAERWDYTLYYSNSAFDAEPYATNYRLSYVYYNYPDNTSHAAATGGTLSFDLQEINAMFSWPKICPFGIVPSYVLVKLWPSNSDSSVGGRSPSGGTASGWAHIFMLDYPLTVPGIMPDTPEQVLNLHTEMVYNDGVSPNGATNVDHDWSNFVLGISTDFNITDNFIFTPGVYHQITMDKSVNPDKDETWVNLGMKYKF